jgi:hypothetical protein
MKRIVIAAALAVALPFGSADAAGPFDGNYSGGEPAMGRMGCPATQATVSVVDSKITGKFTENQFTFNISGTVAPDGTVTGRWAAYPFTGKFAGGRFSGSVNSKECKGERPITLDKSG